MGITILDNRRDSPGFDIRLTSVTKDYFDFIVTSDGDQGYLFILWTWIAIYDINLRINYVHREAPSASRTVNFD